VPNGGVPRQGCTRGQTLRVLNEHLTHLGRSKASTENPLGKTLETGTRCGHLSCRRTRSSEGLRVFLVWVSKGRVALAGPRVSVSSQGHDAGSPALDVHMLAICTSNYGHGSPRPASMVRILGAGANNNRTRRAVSAFPIVPPPVDVSLGFSVAVAVASCLHHNSIVQNCIADHQPH